MKLSYFPRPASNFLISVLLDQIMTASACIGGRRSERFSSKQLIDTWLTDMGGQSSGQNVNPRAYMAAWKHPVVP